MSYAGNGRIEPQSVRQVCRQMQAIEAGKPNAYSVRSRNAVFVPGMLPARILLSVRRPVCHGPSEVEIPLVMFYT